MLLSAPALSDEACEVLGAYVQGGGKLLTIGAHAATLTEDWRERPARPAFAVAPEGAEGLVERAVGHGSCSWWVEDVFAGQQCGAIHAVTLDQAEPAKLAIEGWSKAENVGGAEDAGYSLYVDLTHTDGTPLWGQTATFKTGTHDWQLSRTIITPERPIRSARVHLLFRQHRGTAWFRDVKFGIWDEENGEIVEDLLGELGPDAWAPYRDGYETENMLDMGIWAKMASTKGLSVGAMHEPDEVSRATVLEALKGLLPEEPTLTVEGAGAEKVHAELTRAGDRLLLQLINYGAELHPELPELEQQQAEKSIPARDLVVTLRPRGARLNAEPAEVLWPEGEGNVTCEQKGEGVVVRVGELAQYGAVVLRAD